MPVLTTRDRERLQGEVFWRSLNLDRASVDDGARTVRASLSSDRPVARWFGNEILVHDADAIDLTRAVDGLIMLFNHDRDVPIGLIREIAIEAGRLVGLLQFSNNARALELWADVRDGFLRDMSIGYRLIRWEESADSDDVTVTRWELFEGSLVTIPADPSIGIGRAAVSTTGAAGADKPRSAAMPEPTTTNVTNFQEARALALNEGTEAGIRLEAERRDGIDALFVPERFRGGAFDQLRATAITNRWSVDTTRDELLKLVGSGGVGPLSGGGGATQGDQRPVRGGGYVQSGEDAVEKFMRGAELAIRARADLGVTADERREARDGEFGGYTLSELAREYCRVAGIDVRGLNRDRIVGAALKTRASGVLGYVSGDFPSLLENIANKAALLGYEEAPELWPMIARAGSLPDFRQASRAGLSEFDDLEIVREGGEYRLARPNDRAEKLQLLTFGKMFRHTRQMIVNDDLNQIVMIPRKMGRAAKRAVGDQVFSAFTANPLMNQDGLALFVAGHNNLVAAGNGPPTVAQINTMKALMGRQKDSANAANGLNIRPARLVCPLALEGVSRTLAVAEKDPSTSVGSETPNIHRGTFEVVADARLDAVSATQWYMFADPNLYDVIEVAFLDGQQEPFIETQDGWTIDGAEHKVRIDCVAIPLDFRTMTRNNG